MVKKSFLLVILSLLIASNCLSQSDDDYFSLIAVVSDGRITRFTKLPITVYVEGLDMQGKEYADDLQYALETWEGCSNKMLKFQLVDSPDGANISVSWVKKLEAGDHDHPLGVAELERIDHDKFRVGMRICLRNGTTNKPLTHDQMRTVLLHEFGHAVGLWGHSKDKADVMYYAANAPRPTPRDINTLKLLYSHELNYSLHAESISALREEMRSKPEDARLHFLLGTVYMDQEEYNRAIDSFKKSLSMNHKFHKASIALASAYRASGQDQAALIEYLSLAESDPSAVVHNIIGALYFEKKDTAKAIQHFKKSLELERIYEPAKKNLYKVYLSRGQELINAKTYHAAVALLSDGVGFFPDKPELYDTLGTAYTGSGQFQEAIRQYSRAMRINPAFTSAMKNMASCYNNQGVRYAEAGQWEKAIEAYTESLRLMPDMEEAKKNLRAAYWNRAVGLSKARNDKEAIKAYQQFLTLDPNSRDAHNNLGAIYFRMGDYEGAIAEFQSALESYPTNKDLEELRLLKDNLVIAHHKAGMDMFKKKAVFKAEYQFKKGLEVAPDNVPIRLSLAQLYMNLERWDNAAKHIEKALTLEPNNADAKRIMANLDMQRAYKYLQVKDYDKALEYYSKIPAELMPQDEASHKNLCIIENRFTHVFSSKGISQQTKDRLASVRLNLAMSYMCRRELTKAKNAFGSAIDLNPQDRSLRRLLAEGCESLMLEFTKEHSSKDTRELADWVKQLKSNW